MRRTTWMMLLFALPLAAPIEAAAPHARHAARPTPLVRDGRALLPVVAGSVPEPVEELRRVLKEITGADFTPGKLADGAPALYVGLATDFPHLKIENPAALGAEGFVLRADGKSIYLIGNAPLGVRHAVTTFLHRLGCRWFFPGKTWEAIPRRKTIEVAFDDRSAPSFPINRRIWYGFGAYAPCAKDLVEWNRHNRMGGPLDISLGHSWFGLDPKKDFVTHPEWFALVNGVRRASKPCYSHPEVIKKAVRHAVDVASTGVGMVSLSPPDGLNYCECARCMAVCKGGKPFKKHSTTFATRPDGVLVNVTSETLFRCVNEAAAAVAAKYPKTLIGCLAYSAYSTPPSFKLHPNIFVQATTAFRRTDMTLEEQLTEFKRLGSRAGIYDYFSVYQWDWDASSGRRKMAPDRLRDSLRFYHKNGVTSINAESSNNWGPRGLSYYLAAQLMWDVNADVKALLRDFYDRAFGPAAGAMARYYAHWYGAGANTESAGETDDVKEAPLDRDRLRVLFADLDEAARLAKDNPACLARIDHLRMYLHYLVLRERTQTAAKGKDEKAILKAVEAETLFGARLTYTNILHSRALLGNAFLRRFKPFTKMLEAVPESQLAGKGWRTPTDPPSHEELAKLWEEDRVALGVK